MRKIRLIKNSTTADVAAGALIESEYASDNEFSRVQRMFVCAHPDKEILSGFADTVLLREEDSIWGIAYAYDLCSSGGLFTLYPFDCHSEEQIDEACRQLRRKLDVAKLTVKRIKLVNWVPPAPFFSVAKQPDWIRAFDDGDLAELAQEEFIRAGEAAAGL